MDAGDRVPASTAGEQTRHRGFTVLWLAIVVAVALAQAWAVVSRQGIVWPDEVYQSLEQAHRLVYGYGFIP